MIGTQIKIKNFETGKEVNINDHTDKFRVVALQSFPTLSTDVRANNIPRSGAHGEFHLPTYYSGMSIVLQGVIVGDDEAEVWTLKKLLDSVMALPRNGFGKDQPAQEILPALAVNKAKNPRGFVSTAGWGVTGGSLSNVNGKYGITVASNTSGVTGAAFELPANASEVFHAAIDIENKADAARDFRLTILALDAADATLSSVHVDVNILPGEKARPFISIDLPADTENCLVTVSRETGDADDVFVIDRLLAVVNPPQNLNPETDYFDGDTDKLTRITYKWTGARGLSESQMIKLTVPSMFRHTTRVSYVDPLGKSVFVDATPIRTVTYNRDMQRPFMLNFQIMMRSNFPVKVVDDEFPEIHSGELGVLRQGLKLPFQVPFSLGEQFIENPLTITVDSPGFAVVRMYGSDDGIIVNPKITNLTNGTSCRIIQSLAGSGRYFLIDGLMQTMKDNTGKTVEPFSDGGFVYLDEGENVLLYSADAVIPN